MFPKFNTDDRQHDAASLWEDLTGRTREEAVEEMNKTASIPRLHEKRAMSRAELIGTGVGAVGLGTVMGLSGYAKHRPQKGGRSRAEVDSAVDMLRHAMHRKNERDAGPAGPDDIRKIRSLAAKFKSDVETRKNPGRAAAVYGGIGAIGGGIIGYRASGLSRYGGMTGRYAKRLAGK